MISENMRLKSFPSLTSLLSDYGWFVPPFINGEEHRRIENLVDYIHANPPIDDDARRSTENKIHKELLDVVFSCQVRARYVWLALRTPHISKYSHLYESAVFAYYKREYAAVICLLLVALEGILLSVSGWRMGHGPKPSFSEVKATIATLSLADINPEINRIQEMFRGALSTFIDRWVYAHTSDTDFTLSLLNRHYVLHGMDAGNFYRPHDVHRLLLAFDLLIDLIAMISRAYRVIVEEDIDRYEERMSFYCQLRNGILTLGLVGEREQGLLRQHPNYVPPTMEACVELRIN